MSGKGLPLLSLTPFKQAALFTPVGWRVGEARAARPRLSVDRGPAVGSGQSDSGWCEHMNALTLGGLASAVEPKGAPSVGQVGSPRSAPRSTSSNPYSTASSLDCRRRRSCGSCGFN